MRWPHTIFVVAKRKKNSAKKHSCWCVLMLLSDLKKNTQMFQISSEIRGHEVYAWWNYVVKRQKLKSNFCILDLLKQIAEKIWFFFRIRHLVPTLHFAYGHDLIMHIKSTVKNHPRSSAIFSLQKKANVFMVKPRAKFIGCNFGG